MVILGGHARPDSSSKARFLPRYRGARHRRSSLP
jgi:hypothetical protein